MKKDVSNKKGLVPILDFTHNFKKIFQLAENIRKLRKGFAFSENDARAKHDENFIKKWKKINVKR